MWWGQMTKWQHILELIFVGAFGSWVSLLFRKDLRSKWERSTAVIGGTAIAYYVAPLALDYFKMDASRAGSVTFLLGLFGMTAVAGIMKAIPEAIRSRTGKGA